MNMELIIKFSSSKYEVSSAYLIKNLIEES